MRERRAWGAKWGEGGWTRNSVNLGLEGGIKCDGCWIAPWHYLLGGKTPKPHTPRKQVRKAGLVEKGETKKALRLGNGLRRQELCPAGKGLMERNIPACDAVEELRIFNGRALRDTPSYRGRWSLKKTIKHIDLIMGQLECRWLIGKQLCSLKEVEIICYHRAVNFSQLCACNPVLSHRVSQNQSWRVRATTETRASIKWGSHTRAFVLRDVHCFFAFLFVLSNYT